MSSFLDKRTAIVDLFKTGNSRQDISKSLKVNRMLVWRTLKRYEKTGDIQNRPGQGRFSEYTKAMSSRSARARLEPPNWYNPPEKRLGETPRAIQNLAKESNVSYGIMSTVLRKNLKMSHSSMSRNTNFLLKLLTNDSKNARFFFPAFKMARCQTNPVPPMPDQARWLRRQLRVVVGLLGCKLTQ